jgi:hypothetical protein
MFPRGWYPSSSHPILSLASESIYCRSLHHVYTLSHSVSSPPINSHTSFTINAIPFVQCLVNVINPSTPPIISATLQSNVGSFKLNLES